MLKRISEWLVLTKTEQKVILFLSVSLLIGVGIKLYQVTFASATHFDYSVSDSIFASLNADSIEASYLPSNEAIDKSWKININIASKKELMDLPGIGEITAERIIIYRNEIGKFKSADDLLEIKGISIKKLEKIKQLIIVQ